MIAIIPSCIAFRSSLQQLSIAITALQNMSFASCGTWVGENFLFSEVLESDQRTPCMMFSIPNSILTLFHMEGGGDTFGLLAPRLEFWITMVVALIMSAIFSTFLSIIIYHLIVLPREEQKNKPAQNESTTPFLVGFGIIIPLCTLYPFYIVRFFCVKNKIIKFLTGVSCFYLVMVIRYFALVLLTCFIMVQVNMVVAVFRCSEAMFGFLPTGVDESLTNLIIYNAFPVEVKFNNGVVKSTWGNTSQFLVHWVKYIFILGMYSSILLAYNYQPYPDLEGPSLQDINIRIGFTPQQLINNASVAVLFQVYLTTFGYGLTFLASLCGVQVTTMMLNPLFESTSPSDFWGRKWNMVVHGILKRGVYKPVRTKYPRFVASLATFTASGLFHEWLLSGEYTASVLHLSLRLSSLTIRHLHPGFKLCFLQYVKNKPLCMFPVMVETHCSLFGMLL